MSSSHIAKTFYAHIAFDSISDLFFGMHACVLNSLVHTLQFQSILKIKVIYHANNRGAGA